VINEIIEKYRFIQPEIFLCIKISFLLPVEETLDLHAEEFLSFVQVKSLLSLFVFCLHCDMHNMHNGLLYSFTVMCEVCFELQVPSLSELEKRGRVLFMAFHY
jgi:fumarate reductase subunit D